MGDFTHAICDDCWRDAEPDKEPHRFKPELAHLETCCFCGVCTRSGIYIRRIGARPFCRHGAGVPPAEPAPNAPPAPAARSGLGDQPWKVSDAPAEPSLLDQWQAEHPPTHREARIFDPATGAHSKKMVPIEGTALPKGTRLECPVCNRTAYVVLRGIHEGEAFTASNLAYGDSSPVRMSDRLHCFLCKVRFRGISNVPLPPHLVL